MAQHTVHNVGGRPQVRIHDAPTQPETVRNHVVRRRKVELAPRQHSGLSGVVFVGLAVALLAMTAIMATYGHTGYVAGLTSEGALAYGQECLPALICSGHAPDVEAWATIHADLIDVGRDSRLASAQPVLACRALNGDGGAALRLHDLNAEQIRQRVWSGGKPTSDELKDFGPEIRSTKQQLEQMSLESAIKAENARMEQGFAER